MSGHVQPGGFPGVQEVGEPAQGAVGAVLEDDEHDRDAVAGGRPQRGDAVVGRAVPDHTDHRRLGAGQLHADGGR